MLALSGGPNDVTVRQLRARVSPDAFDPLATRLHLARLLSNWELTVPWLAPSAILCIRHLPDPRPGVLRLDAREVRPPLDWERALLATVEEKVRRAARPALGGVPGDAEAVVFADRGELLACLALDLGNGLAGARWWWAALFRKGSLAHALVSSLEQQPEYVPPVLERALTAGRIQQIFQSLPEQASVSILRALVERFAIPVERSRSPSHRLPFERAEERVPTGAFPGGGSRSVSIGEWIAERELDGLAPEARALVATALLLRRAPFAVRSAWFATEIPTLRGELRPKDRVAPSAIAPETRQVAEARGIENKVPSVELPELSTAAVVEGVDEPSRVGPNVEKGAGPREAPSSPQPFEAASADVEESTSAPRHASLPPDPEVEPIEATTIPASCTDAHAGPGESPAARPSAISELQRVYGAATATKLGGVFYLVNVALALELYPDFTRPLSRGLELSIWDFVGLVAERLLGAAEPDPIWALLTVLAGRAGEPLSLEGVVPPERRLPPGWPLPEVTTAVERDTFEGWLEWLLPPLRSRLERALGLEPAGDLADVLLRHAARVHVSESHVDVLLSLAELPVAIRAAGLDRDPGFIPPAGRILAFHFS